MSERLRRQTTPVAAVGAVASSTPAVGGESFPVIIKSAGRKKKGWGRKRGAQADLPSTLPQQSLAPPPTNLATAPANPDGAAWSQVVGRRSRRAAGTASAAPVTPAPPQKSTSKRAGVLMKAPPRVVAPPRSAAVTITVLEGRKATYEEAIRRARQGEERKEKKGRRGVAGVAPPSTAAQGGGGDAILPSTPSVPAAMEVEAVASGQVHCLAECRVGLAVTTEPYQVPDHPHWFGDEDGLVAVWRRRHSATVPPCTVVQRGRGMILVKWGRFLVAGCYNSPNCGSAEFGRYLDQLGAMVPPYMAGPVLVLGDLNARSTAWGNPGTSSRGGALQEWAEGMELRLLNRGFVPTCVRWNGWFIVDVSFASAAASRWVSNWRVWEGETLSDHSYILMDVAVVSDPPADAPHPT
ncbi:uncharacterized protein LOC128875357 [Hylaeus volcanicus]|uniref:uncharacterized protein LOC128875357 n=1 Tax=Hylaeus volcanicus TaxID=313075 RepID=UPI0023B83873|nr:uncharacterized protein LOC128875357 [Hylaeus volcanicus]